MRIMILGNPNAGKTSLFNLLTHQQKKVANYAGVTIEAEESKLFQSPEHQLIDLPGFYSLSAGQLTGLEMQFAADQLLKNKPDLILNVVDATQLERQLLLTSQLMELGIPMVLVLTHMDRFKQSHQPIDILALQSHLALPVIPIAQYALTEELQVLAEITNISSTQYEPHIMAWPKSLSSIFKQNSMLGQGLFALRRFLESGEFHLHRLNLTDELYQQYFSQDVLEAINETEQQGIDFELEMMDARYQFVHNICQKVIPIQHPKVDILTQKLDRYMLHRYLGWPIFLSILWLFFSIAIHIGGTVQQVCSDVVNQFFNEFLNGLLTHYHVYQWFKWMIVNGLGQGITTMVSFLPVMALMNLFLSLMESTGYMARVAFLFERIMRLIGLPGKAFLPLLIGFGCNVPAIMSARIVEGKHERLLTVLLSPFMSCSARLTIYAVFASLFFPQSGGWVVLSLYLLGVVMAILTGYFLRQVWLTGAAVPLMIELPSYKIPNIKLILRDVVLRLKLFIQRSGKLVVGFCVVLGGVQAALQGDFAHLNPIQQFLWTGWQYVFHPLLSPMGIRLENWPAAIGLLTGTMAKEVVIATLNTLYSQLPHASGMMDVLTPASSFISTPTEWSSVSSKVLFWAFSGWQSAYSYLLFVLLYIPCISTLAIIRQEVGSFWQWFAFIWSLLLAYSVACLFYQTSMFFAHPWQTGFWWMGLSLFWSCLFYIFKSWRPSYVGRN
jgi:ferrous iron transport protein B